MFWAWVPHYFAARIRTRGEAESAFRKYSSAMCSSAIDRFLPSAFASASIFCSNGTGTFHDIARTPSGFGFRPRLALDSGFTLLAIRRFYAKMSAWSKCS